MKTMVQFEDVTKKYGEKTAVENLNLGIAEGELFALVGPNGAGKTTTLKTLTGLLKATAGKITIGGFDINQEPIKAKSIMSFVPDIPYVYEKLTPREFLRFVGKLHYLAPGIIEEKSSRLLRFFELSHVADVLIEEFSHGMRQKAILSAALLHDPKVFVLDEPMVGLDPPSIKSFKDFMRQQAADGMTIVLSTHTLSMAEELAQRIGIIHQGHLVALGSMAELQERYQSKENLEHMFMQLVKQEER